MGRGTTLKNMCTSAVEGPGAGGALELTLSASDAPMVMEDLSLLSKDSAAALVQHSHSGIVTAWRLWA